MASVTNHTAWIPCSLLPPPADPRPVRRFNADSVNEPLTTIDEAQLVQRIAQRDRQALSQLYDRYAGVLYGTAMRIVNDPDEASDILRAVFLQIWNQPGAYDPWLGRPFHWALTLTRNLAIDRLRLLKRRYRFLEEETGEQDHSASAWAAGPSEFIDQKKVASIRATVQTKDFLGVVQRVHLRWTEVLTPQGQLVLIPNKQVFENPITNYTASGKRRVDIKLGVSYSDDLEKVRLGARREDESDRDLHLTVSCRLRNRSLADVRLGELDQLTNVGVR